MDRSKQSHGTSADQLDSFTQGFVRKCARNLIGKFGFRHQDRDDIEQRLYLKLAKHLPAAQPDDPKWKAFVSLTVKRHIVNMVRDREAAKRDDRGTCSIYVRIGAPNDAVELSATLIHREIPSRRGRSNRTEQELLELLIDVADSISAVADDKQRELLERLESTSIAQIAREMGVPRTTLNSWLPRLREHFEKRSLKEYL
ncbi:hypothetical protein ETAA8_40580 [Anatilimnocola aggregata]|uniref:Sigma-70 family RNA polymerase sigma factor n=1 Tax=Anatilimnocola aggregata TaxID=2528021 RepID=A0A517YFL1_9BACT|nr:sigma-70 family RNA polymerase sigma factor [Anatilimnocola aggregata]QDU28952.1 hypothetical protein ETAA8_40580 [Anatilimnocola aggregata]